MAKYRFERATGMHDKCKYSGPNGECPFKRIPETDYCPRHGGNKKVIAAEVAENRLYLVAKWQQRIGAKVDNPRAKTLAEEVGIIRLMIENRLAQCLDDSDLLLASSSLTQMLASAEKLVSSHHKIEKERALLLDPDRAQKLASDIVTAITNYLDDPDILKALTEDITDLFAKLNQ
jgi:hypothetical protein